MLASEPDMVSPEELDRLWDLFLQIAVIWQNRAQEMRGKRSSWLEFVRERCLRQPSYLAEYRNACKVIDHLLKAGDFASAAKHLFLEHQLPVEKPKGVWSREWTLVDHAKKYVCDEFVRVYIVAAGFRDFGSDPDGKNRKKRRPYNYNGFVRGSRYNRVKRVRHYDPLQSRREELGRLLSEIQGSVDPKQKRAETGDS